MNYQVDYVVITTSMHYNTAILLRGDKLGKTYTWWITTSKSITIMSSKNRIISNKCMYNIYIFCTKYVYSVLCNLNIDREKYGHTIYGK